MSYYKISNYLNINTTKVMHKYLKKFHTLYLSENYLSLHGYNITKYYREMTPHEIAEIEDDILNKSEIYLSPIKTFK